MTTSIELLRPAGLVQSPAFSHVAVIPPGATQILVGGQNGVDDEGRLVGDDIVAQVEQTMANLRTALEAAGATTADLVSLTVLLVEGVGHSGRVRRGGPSAAGGRRRSAGHRGHRQRARRTGRAGRGGRRRRGRPMTERPAGRTKDAGWEIGVSRTVPVPDRGGLGLPHLRGRVRGLAGRRGAAAGRAGCGVRDRGGHRRGDPQLPAAGPDAADLAAGRLGPRQHGPVHGHLGGRRPDQGRLPPGAAGRRGRAGAAADALAGRDGRVGRRPGAAPIAP